MKEINFTIYFKGEESLFKSNSFNLNRLGTCLDVILDQKAPGINTPFLYYGTWRSTLGLHTEDCDLYSVSFLHYGEPKVWYAIPPKCGEAFEKLVKGILIFIQIIDFLLFINKFFIL